MSDLVFRLRKRAEIRRQITTRKSVQNNEPDRIADLLEEAAARIEFLENRLEQGGRTVPKASPTLMCSTCHGTTRVQIPCPDDKPGCLVFHSALCPACKGWAVR